MEDKELEECYRNCMEYSNRIKNSMLRECCQEIYKDYKEELMNKPATPGRHHYFKGGLLYHIYCVTRTAYQIAKTYERLKVDMDLIIFGALLHDIGKTKNYNDFCETENYKIKKGNGSELLGHSYQGTHIVDNYLSKYEIEEDFKNQALHMIGNHMKEFMEEGAFVETKMLEAIIISFADSLDNYLEPASKRIDKIEKGEKYEIPVIGIPYYKSINPFYD